MSTVPISCNISSHRTGSHLAKFGHAKLIPFWHAMSLSLLAHLVSPSRVLSRFLSSRFHPRVGDYFHFISPISRSYLQYHAHDLLTFGVTSAIFKIAGEIRWLPAYFDNPDQGYFGLNHGLSIMYKNHTQMYQGCKSKLGHIMDFL